MLWEVIHWYRRSTRHVSCTVCRRLKKERDVVWLYGLPVCQSMPEIEELMDRENSGVDLDTPTYERRETNGLHP